MEGKIKELMELTMLATNPKAGVVQFWLVGIVPALITWADHKTERIELAQRIPVEPFSAGKVLLGRRIARKMFADKLKNEHGAALLAKMCECITEVQKAKKLAGKPFNTLVV